MPPFDPYGRTVIEGSPAVGWTEILFTSTLICRGRDRKNHSRRIEAVHGKHVSIRDR